MRTSLLRLLAVLASAWLAACTATPRTPLASCPEGAGRLAETPPCPRVHTGEELERSGAATTGQALRLTDPAVTVRP